MVVADATQFSAVQVVDAYDAIRVNAGSIPHGAQAAGYSTGSGVVPWTQADWDAHPGAVRIDQDPSGSDLTADIYDVEDNAGKVSRTAGWAHSALADYRTGARKGQRSPGIYGSGSWVTSICNALISGGIRSGVGLWVASWGIGRSAAAAMVQNAGGPFPVIGVQFDDKGPDGQPIDSDVFSAAWLAAVSGKAPADPGPGPGQPPKAPEYRLTKGNESMRGFAHYHGMTVQEVIALTCYQQHGHFGVFEGPYISGGDWGSNLPKGSGWWIGPNP